MTGKRYHIPGEQIRPLATGRGGCLATDRITVDGEKVAYMYREPTTRDLDSGWRFFAGDEDDAYMADASKHGVYDVNTIANYDPEIILFLDAPQGSCFGRDSEGRFQPEERPPFE